MSTPSTLDFIPSRNRDDWQPLPAEEWTRRLQVARQQALTLLAGQGLNLNGGIEVSALIAELGLGALLDPSLAGEVKRFDALVQAAATRGEDLRDMPSEQTNYVIALTEAAFLFGCIAGCHLPWSVVEAMPAPCAPQEARGTKGKRS
jgi:hypothetical protein